MAVDERGELIADESGRGAVAPAGEIGGILQKITALISDADRRQVEALRELHARLAGLGREAGTVRSQVPQEYVPAFERIEDGLSQIAERIVRSQAERGALRAAAAVTEAPGEVGDAVSAEAYETAAAYAVAGGAAAMASPPAPLRSALAVAEPLRGSLRPDHGRAAGGGVDTFDIVDSTRPGDVDQPWDSDSAEALTRVYESLAAQGRSAGWPADASQAALQHAGDADARGWAHAAAATSHADPAAVAAQQQAAERPVLDIGRDWLEERFAEIASRVEQSLAELRNEPYAVTLDSRLDAFEHRFGEVLAGIGSRGDAGSLREFEGHLDSLAQHVEQAQLQLQRLDTIEAQLNAVMEKLSDQRLSQILEQSAPAAIDADRIAQAAAEQVAQRMASIVPAAGASSADVKRLDELRHLLSSFIAERRQGEEQTVGMLDTMQQAMIRLLDRVDSLELASQAAPVAAPLQPSHAAAAPQQQQQPAPTLQHEPDRRPAAAPASVVSVGEPAAPATSRLAGDMTREQLILEARRAMQIAAAKREEEAQAETAAASPSGAATGKAGKAAKAGGEAGGIGKNTKRLMVGAVALLALSSAVLLMIPRKHNPAQPDVRAGQTKQPAATVDSTARSAAPAKAATAPQSSAATSGPAAATASGSASGPVSGPASGPVYGTASGPAQAAQQPVSPPAAAKSADARPAEPRPGEPAGNEARVARPSPIPPGFLPKTVPESGIDELSHDPARGPAAATSQEASARAVFPGISVVQGDEGSDPREAARQRERQRMAALSTRIGAAQAGGAPQTSPLGRVIPVAGTPVQAAGADGGANRTAPQELPPAAVGPLSLRQAAATGDPSAEFEVAARFAEGRGIQQSFQQALRWYQRSASQGFPQAQYRLGTLYERGLGTKADPARARVWYQQAAEQGHVKAMHNLAVLSASRDQAQPDYTTAARWFQSAAEHGLADSQYNLAVLHESGLGVAKDLQQAYKWYAVARRLGDREAGKRLDMLRARIPADEIASGEALAASFEVRPADRLVNDAHTAGEAWKARARVGAAG